VSPNTTILQTQVSTETAFLGDTGTWLKDKLKHSDTIWKVISADMPIGPNAGDGVDAQGNARWEAIANNNDGQALGRELEIAGLLKFIKHQHTNNIVWLTADVHYALPSCRHHERRQSHEENEV